MNNSLLKKRKFISVFITLILVLSMVIILPQSVAITDAYLSRNGSVIPLICGEIITLEVTDNSLIPDEDYSVEVWNGTAWIELENGDADRYGDISLDFHVPGWDEFPRLQYHQVSHLRTGFPILFRKVWSR